MTHSDKMASSSGDACCMVAPARDERDKQALIVGGILNLLIPFGIGTLLCATLTGRRSMAFIGFMQFLATFLIFGVIWSFVYGILMLVAAFGTDNRLSSLPQTHHPMKQESV